MHVGIITDNLELLDDVFVVSRIIKVRVRYIMLKNLSIMLFESPSCVD